MRASLICERGCSCELAEEIDDVDGDRDRYSMVISGNDGVAQAAAASFTVNRVPDGAPAVELAGRSFAEFQGGAGRQKMLETQLV